MTFRKGTTIFDKCTDHYGTVKSHHTTRDDYGKWITYYLLDGVPARPNYPTGWRHHGEVATRKPKESAP